MNTRRFEGVWISREIWLSKDLTLQEKAFFVEIRSLDNEEGCFASNAYFAEFFNLSKDRAGRVINSLVKKCYIKSTIIYKKGTKHIEKRVLNACDTLPVKTTIPLSVKTPIPPRRKQRYPIGENAAGNNTLNNTINKNPEIENFVGSFQNYIFKNFKNAPKVNGIFLSDCYDEVEKLIRIDKYDLNYIKEVMRWSIKDRFWTKKALSLKQLRRNKDGLTKFQNIANSYESRDMKAETVKTDYDAEYKKVAIEKQKLELKEKENQKVYENMLNDPQFVNMLNNPNSTMFNECFNNMPQFSKNRYRDHDTGNKMFIASMYNSYKKTKHEDLTD